MVTEKGKGHPFGKDVKEKYHAVPKFDIITGEHKKSASKKNAWIPEKTPNVSKGPQPETAEIQLKKKL